jgi:hypothetical protein
VILDAEKLDNDHSRTESGQSACKRLALTSRPIQWGGH